MTVPPTTLVTDLYHLTMAQGYWHAGVGEREACFEYFTRRNPFGGQYTVTAGLEDALAFLEGFRFFQDETRYLETLGLFRKDFLEHLLDLRFRGDVHAMAEGTVAFPMEPILRVTGRLEECQLVESALLNIMNFQSLVATKACRICLAAGDGEVIEFGLRRAQGVDGALTAARAAHIGGCTSTSNLQAGKRYGIPVRGTHAHSFVMAFESELEAFRRYAEMYGSSTILLVDTYDTLLSGVPNAITVAREMERSGGRLAGIRLDSGDAASLGSAARRMLDEADLGHVRIVCSGDLDEHAIHDLVGQGAGIDTWGVGTRLVTAHGDPALAGVYKLVALRNADGSWQGRLKVSDDESKSTLPGPRQVFRLSGPGDELVADWIELEGEEPDAKSGVLGHYLQGGRGMELVKGAHSVEPLLEPVMRQGSVVVDLPELGLIRSRARAQVERLPDEARRLEDPGPAPVLLGPRLLEQTRLLRSPER